jgi:hypothetical protein
MTSLESNLQWNSDKFPFYREILTNSLYSDITQFPLPLAMLSLAHACTRVGLANWPTVYLMISLQKVPIEKVLYIHRVGQKYICIYINTVF